MFVATLAGLSAVASGFGASSAQTIQPLLSPNGEIAVAVHVTDKIAYDVSLEDRVLMKDNTLSLTIDKTTFGRSPKVTAATTRSHQGVIKPPVHQKAAEFREAYNELRLELEGGAAVVFRAYDEGVAYRWETKLSANDVTVSGEEVAFNFTGNHFVFYPEEQSFYSHNERLFLPRALGDLAPKNIASIPAVVDVNGVKIAIADADVENYPGLWLKGTEASGLAGTFPPYAIEEQYKADRDVRVTKGADYIAKTTGTRSYPWRLMALARKDGDLITNPLVYLLAAPSRVADTSWIKPGKVAWDWWNANNLHGVDFRAGVNTATYKYFIDFASANGIQYIVLDEGWYKLGNVLDVVPEMNIQELVDYGRQKNVGVILWVVWKTLDDQLKPALDQFVKWGVVGIKVDFMQRDDQRMMDYYHKISREAAERHLLVDFHGAIRPAALTRTWPNLISAEGVRGNEWNKWSEHITPEHKATLPFTRMFVGPMDFTPGATRNATIGNHSFNHFRPSSQGTRANEMALYVVYESPLQMLCDTPTNYQREPDMMDFLRAVPSTWDETKVIDAKISDYVLVARRNGKDWYVGAITDASPRELSLDLSFLPAGNFQLDEYRDGINADQHAEDFKRVKQTVTNATKLTLKLAPGGGWVGRITPQ